MTPFSAREWADLHGEERMSRKELDRQEAAERQRRHQLFTLQLSGDELDWLFAELLERAIHYRKQDMPGEALDVEGAIKDWTAQAADQGYLG